MHFPIADPRTQAFTTLMFAAALLYAAGRIATFALARPDGLDAGRRAIAQSAPIAGTVLVAICMNHADIALSLILGTSIASLSLAVGMVTWLNPMQALPPSRKAWPFVLPTALLVLMAGFSGHLAWWHALMFLGLGWAILGVWVDSPEPGGISESPSELAPPADQAIVIALLAAALIILGGYLAIRGTMKTCSIRDSRTLLIYPGSIAATILSPLLILPTLGTASAVAQRGHPGRAVSALVGTVLLNLCVLLPVAVLIWHFQPGDWNLHISKAFNIRWDRRHTLPFDLPAWQIETVSLIVLGFGLIPISFGRWTMGRVESTLLIMAYGGYVVTMAVFGMYQL